MPVIIKLTQRDVELSNIFKFTRCYSCHRVKRCVKCNYCERYFCNIKTHECEEKLIEEAMTEDIIEY